MYNIVLNIKQVQERHFESTEVKRELKELNISIIIFTLILLIIKKLLTK